jgi:GNAT superfamily N-acetyltransferase
MPGVRLLRVREQVVMDHTIRLMIQSDIDAIAHTFASWKKKREQYDRYFEENRLGERITLVAVLDDEVVGYVNVLWTSDYEFFQRNQIPEINDLNVINEHQKRGIGRALIHAAEGKVAEAGRAVIGIGVGQTPDYAAAQHLYSKLGYVPDGRGVRATQWDDVAYLTKRL